MNSTDPGHRWYALQIRSRFEKLATTHLVSRGHDAYLPLFTSRRTWSDRTKTLEVPLFPGYTFCRFDVRDRLPILVTPGVIGVVGIGKVPSAIPDEEILAIQSVIASGSPYGPSEIHVGHRVRIAQGALTGLEGTVVRVQSNFRLIVTLPLIQRSVFVEIDSACIEVVADQSRSNRTSPVSNSDLTVKSAS